MQGTLLRSEPSALAASPFAADRCAPVHACIAQRGQMTGRSHARTPGAGAPLHQRWTLDTPTKMLEFTLSPEPVAASTHHSFTRCDVHRPNRRATYMLPVDLRCCTDSRDAVRRISRGTARIGLGPVPRKMRRTESRAWVHKCAHDVVCMISHLPRGCCRVPQAKTRTKAAAMVHRPVGASAHRYPIQAGRGMLAATSYGDPVGRCAVCRGMHGCGPATICSPAIDRPRPITFTI